MADERMTAEDVEREQLLRGSRLSGEQKVAFFQSALDLAHASGALDADRLDLRDDVMLFFALRPDAETSALIRDEAQRLFDTLGLAPTRRQRNLHITLTLPGAAKRLRPERDVALLRAGAQVRGVAFDVVLDTAMGFAAKENFPFVLTADAASEQALLSLRNEVRAKLAAEGFVPSGSKDFLPHLTLAYTGEACVAERPVTPIRWRANELALIRSHIGQGRHEIMGLWPLSADA